MRYKLIVDVHVENLSRAVAFYQNVLGFQIRVHENIWAAVMVGGAEIHLYIGAGATGHVEFEPEDFDEEIKRLKSIGVKFYPGSDKSDVVDILDECITIFPWGRAAYFRDSEGNELALVKDF